MCRQPLQHARIYTHALIVAPPTEGVPDSEDVSDHVDGDAGTDKGGGARATARRLPADALATSIARRVRRCAALEMRSPSVTYFVADDSKINSVRRYYLLTVTHLLSRRIVQGDDPDDIFRRRRRTRGFRCQTTSDAEDTGTDFLTSDSDFAFEDDKYPEETDDGTT
ncbi:hypothetical protein ROHU_003840 [Labeo rohita]|uniref:Uncharacterized protein n=1 Tax=Labeo rohita TaxID=84645 RepID=A0A498NUE5_LABRO|nr:hypothetical protein ROHU_003840 [Labeo rohita]